ncbi:NlpC/P60 family protein [Paenibacillus hamazuiensis]|uniref:NlpC/P60 family protein n=1 Tax=Paenibacillus hamazuiensis TaxID=2936508 RepID=UPI00200FFD31|nr:NlpC/P60 family protein [Paenibacillus hamazuiensis]
MKQVLNGKKWILLSAVLAAALHPGAAWASYAETTEQAEQYYEKYYTDYTADELSLVGQYRTANAAIKKSTADRLVERAFWYMQNGYIVYGHGNDSYKQHGIADCSEFVSLVYGDFGYSVTEVAKDYDTVGQKVNGVYSTTKVYPNGKTYNALAGTENLKIGDILTWYKTDAAGNKYISHVAIYIGMLNGQPAVIGTVDQDTGKNPTAIGIINDFRYTWGGTLNSVRRVLPSDAWNANTQVSGHAQQSPVIPDSYVLPPQNPIVMPVQ